MSRAILRRDRNSVCTTGTRSIKLFVRDYAYVMIYIMRLVDKKNRVLDVGSNQISETPL